jgi:hypothetical protein
VGLGAEPESDVSGSRNETVDLSSGVGSDGRRETFTATNGRSWPVNRSTNDLPHIEHLTNRPLYSAGASNLAWQYRHSTVGMWRPVRCGGAEDASMSDGAAGSKRLARRV